MSHCFYMHFLKSLVPQSVKNWYHLAQAVAANVWYGFPGRKLKVIGVTGTDGKTTTTQFVGRILEEAGHKVAVASTINFRVGGEERVNRTKFTTLSSFGTQRFLREALDAKCDYAVLETGSHALDQHRVWGVDYLAAVITNVTREHLDYHKTMERYRRAKRRLFDRARIAVVNLDMERPEEFLEGKYEKKITYGRSGAAQVLAQKVALSLDGSTFEVDGQAFRLHVPGAFNVENALAAIAVGLSQGVPFPVMSRALEKVRGVPGRMEKVPNGRGIEILIDYAVTPHALEKLYGLVSEMKPTSGSRVIAVFGACGERDRGKRPIMGEIVSSYADIVILTNEDPYHEDPERIVREIRQGIRGKAPKADLWTIMDRRKAIRKALRLALPGDVVVVSGKGAEETMAVGDRRIPWNDRKVIEEILREEGSR
jgi:UDP-N-acetylmuramoyl-L-alanyl-D-glutamate--2,6-diaminopimelate ligase